MNGSSSPETSSTAAMDSFIHDLMIQYEVESSEQVTIVSDNANPVTLQIVRKRSSGDSSSSGSSLHKNFNFLSPTPTHPSKKISRWASGSPSMSSDGNASLQPSPPINPSPSGAAAALTIDLDSPSPSSTAMNQQESIQNVRYRRRLVATKNRRSNLLQTDQYLDEKNRRHWADMGDPRNHQQQGQIHSVLHNREEEHRIDGIKPPYAKGMRKPNPLSSSPSYSDSDEIGRLVRRRRATALTTAQLPVDTEAVSPNVFPNRPPPPMGADSVSDTAKMGPSFLSPSSRDVRRMLSQSRLSTSGGPGSTISSTSVGRVRREEFAQWAKNQLYDRPQDQQELIRIPTGSSAIASTPIATAPASVGSTPAIDIGNENNTVQLASLQPATSSLKEVEDFGGIASSANQHVNRDSHQETPTELRMQELSLQDSIDWIGKITSSSALMSPPPSASHFVPPRLDGDDGAINDPDYWNTPPLCRWSSSESYDTSPPLPLSAEDAQPTADDGQPDGVALQSSRVTSMALGLSNGTLSSESGIQERVAPTTMAQADHQVNLRIESRRDLTSSASVLSSSTSSLGSYIVSSASASFTSSSSSSSSSSLSASVDTHQELQQQQHND